MSEARKDNDQKRLLFLPSVSASDCRYGTSLPARGAHSPPHRVTLIKDCFFVVFSSCPQITNVNIMVDLLTPASLIEILLFLGHLGGSGG